MKLRFLADANIDPDVWRGLCRREPGIDMEGHVGVIPDGMTDPEVLKLAAEAGRVLVSADIKTMPRHFAEYVRHAESPGLILVPSTRPITAIIEGLLLVWVNWTPEQLRNQARWLPLAGKPE